MPKFKTCSFSGCLTNARDNPGVSFFRYPTKDPQRCLLWVRASNNDVISGQYLSGGHISDNETVCELHFSLEDITVYSSRKLLATNAVPIDEVRTAVPLQANTTADTNYGHSYKSGKTFASHKVNKKSFAQKTIRKYNKSFAKPKSLKPLSILKSPKSAKNSLEIIEINGNYKAGESAKKRKKTSNTNCIEIIELEDYREGTDDREYGSGSASESYNNGNNNGFLMAHELFGFKSYTNN